MLDSRPFLSHQLMGQEARANNVHFYTGENVQINIDINMDGADEGMMAVLAVVSAPVI